MQQDIVEKYKTKYFENYKKWFMTAHNVTMFLWRRNCASLSLMARTVSGLGRQQMKAFVACPAQTSEVKRMKSVT
jgi:hypothetical protein